MLKVLTERQVAFFLAFLTSLIFSFHYIAAKDVLEHVHPLMLSGVRGFVGGLILFIFFWKKIKDHLEVKTLMNIFFVGIFGFCLNQIFFMYGLKETDAVNASVIINTIPIVSTLMAIVVGVEAYQFKKVFGIFLGFVMVGLIVFFKFKGAETKINLTGDLFVFLNVIFFSASFVIGKKILKNDIPDTLVSSGMLLMGGAVLFLFSIKHYPEIIEYAKASGRNQLILLFEIIGSTSLVYFLNFRVLKTLAPSETTVFIFLQPVLTTTIDFFLYKRIPSFYMLPIFLGIVFAGYLVTSSKSD